MRKYDEQFALFSAQFKNSADKLIDDVGENRGHIVDGFINPALFLYRHSIELCLKAILYKVYLENGVEYEKIKEKLEGHRLDSLWSKVDNEVRSKYNFVNNQQAIAEFRRIGKLIKELHDTDDTSMTFRYPFDKDLEEFQYGNGKESFGIDFGHMKNEIDFVHSRLYYWIYERVSTREEW